MAQGSSPTPLPVALVARDRLAPPVPHPASSGVRAQAAAVAALTLFAASVLAGPLWLEQGLVNDREALFSLFADNLFSLNRFGEFAWWHPGVQLGFPQYYISILGWTALEPIYAALCALAWISGRLGIMWSSYVTVYYAYSFFLVPLNLVASLWVLARTLFKDQRTVHFVMAASVFSPGVLSAYTDNGIELTPYGLYFLASVIHFVRASDRRRFLLMTGTLLLVAVGFNHIFLYWQLLLLGIVAGVVLWRAFRAPQSAWNTVRQVAWPWWVAAAGALVLCIAPGLITYSHGVDIVRSVTGTRTYDFWLLRPGNPLEMLAQSTPGVGFEWARYRDPAAPFMMYAMDTRGQYMSYGYGGMLLLPLAWLGAFAGRRRWRGCVQAVLVLGMAIVVLSAYSPFMSPAFLLPSPLRAVNHYSDTSLRFGFFALFLIAAGMGLEAALRFRVVRRRLLPRAFAAGTAFSLAVLLTIIDTPLDHYVFGLFCVFAFLYSVALFKLATARGRAAAASAFGFVLVLTLVDTATFANQYLRLVLVPNAVALRTPEADEDFLSGKFAGSRARGLLLLAGLDTPAQNQLRQRWPRLTLLETGGSERASSDEVILVTDTTFNQLRLRVAAPAATTLLWRDANFPFWEATVDGTPVPIGEAVAHLKTVPVPAGAHKVEFRFRPARLALSIVLAYLVIAGAFVAAWRARPSAPSGSP